MITIHLECPHCQKVSKIHISDPLWIMLETCRNCEEWNLVFMGAITSLDKEIMEASHLEDKQNHVLGKLEMLLEILVRMVIPDPVEE